MLGAESEDQDLFLAAQFVVWVLRIVGWMAFFPHSSSFGFDDTFYLIKGSGSVILRELGSFFCKVVSHLISIKVTV